MIHVNLIGRFGNCLFQLAHAFALAQQRGEPLSYSHWIGERIFDLPPSAQADPNDCELVTGYCQDQASLIYTRKQALEWFRFRPEIAAILEKYLSDYRCTMRAHHRVGDYPALGYPCIRKESYLFAAKEFGFDPMELAFSCEESPTPCPELDSDMSFLPDFYLLMRARVLFRGNSSFSWWSAVLGNAEEVFSPRIDNIVDGHCRFQRGNHARFCLLPFVTDLRLRDA